jgi:SAM-dependent methyltransferase
MSHGEEGDAGREPWYRRWFGTRYLELYPHRDRDEARDAVDLLLERADPSPGPILDLGCGAGRHLEALRERGRAAVGLDLSAPLLAEAARSGASRLVRGDMRALPFSGSCFQAVTSFFTSFGYFRDPADDGLVLEEAARVLVPDGVFFLDYLNAPRVREDLVPEDEREVRGRRVIQRRWIEGGMVEKRIEIHPEGGGGEASPSVFRERVRLYEADELEEMLRSRGFRVEDRLGEYDGSPHDRDTSRVILVARLEEARPAGRTGSGTHASGTT